MKIFWKIMATTAIITSGISAANNQIDYATLFIGYAILFYLISMESKK